MMRRFLLILLALLAPALAQPEDPQPDEVDQPASEESALEKRIALFQKEGAPFKFLIVSLPDPIDSHLAREFDLYLTSLIRGFELHEYRIRDVWLPWLEGLNQAKAGTRGAFDKALHETMPGLLIFQPGSSSAADPTVAALLVGESPVRGVQRDALSEALQIASKPLADDGCKLHLLGPSYSGSADSLGQVLSDFLAGHQSCRSKDASELQVSVLSGSATSPAVQARLDFQGVTYQAQSTTDDVKQREMLGYLKRLGISRIAMLVENSTYGQGFEQGKFQLVLPFPMHISSIRSLYSEDRKEALKQNGDNQAPGPSQLAVDLADPQDVIRDGLPIFERGNTPATLDLVLRRILKRLVRHKTEAVGIVATNIKDKLFLADEINRYAPNVRIFTYEGDELLTHPEYARATRGMLVASSHSLSLEWLPKPNPQQDKAQDGPLVETRFGNDPSQGVFEAAFRIVQQLRGQPRDRYTDSLSCHFSKEAGPDDAPVWISVVGREGLYPVQVTGASRSGDLAVLSANSFVALAPRGWILTCLLMLLVLVYLWLWVEEVESPSSQDTSGAWQGLKSTVSHLYLFVPRAKEAEHLRLQALSLALLGIAGLGYLVIEAPVLARLATWYWSQNGNWLGKLAILSVMGLMLLPLVAVTVKLTKGSARLAGGSLIHHLAFGLGYLAFYGFVLGISFGPSERALNLNSGVSPTLPILLLLGVLTLWVLTGVYRCHVMQDLAATSNGERKLLDLAMPRLKLLPQKEQFLTRNFILLVLATVVLPSIYLLLYFFSFPVRGIETNPFFDWGIFVLLLVSVLLVSEAFYRCLSAWKQLRQAAKDWLDQNFELRSHLTGAGCPPASPKEPAPSEQREDSQAYLGDVAERAKKILNQLIGQIRTLLLFSTVALVLILAALLTYPFEPDRVLALYMSLLIGAGALAAVIVNLQIGKSEALRCIRRMEEGWWTWERAGRMLFYLGVPAAGLIASRFPGTLDSLLGWLEPIFNLFA